MRGEYAPMTQKGDKVVPRLVFKIDPNLDPIHALDWIRYHPWANFLNRH